MTCVGIVVVVVAVVVLWVLLFYYCFVKVYSISSMLVVSADY